MSADRFTLTVHGVRGSISSGGAETRRYGGNTACLSVRLAEAEWLVLDCGTGLRGLRAEVEQADRKEGTSFHVFFTHVHWDHICGLPFFPPLFDRSSRFRLYGRAWNGWGIQRLLEDGLRPPWFPVPLESVPAARTYLDLSDKPVPIGGLIVRNVAVSHPQGCTAYRLEHDGGAAVFATDLEPGHAGTDRQLVEFSRGASILIHDAQYTPEELAERRGRGHATWVQAAEAAREAGVQRLLLFHHDPDRTDDALDEIVRSARGIFPNTEAAREGSTVRF